MAINISEAKTTSVWRQSQFETQLKRTHLLLEIIKASVIALQDGVDVCKSAKLSFGDSFNGLNG